MVTWRRLDIPESLSFPIVERVWNDMESMETARDPKLVPDWISNKGI